MGADPGAFPGAYLLGPRAVVRIRLQHGERDFLKSQMISYASASKLIRPFLPQKKESR